ncbi:MAG: DegQ family serine endoprotease [Acidobacteriota bacterium]|nr:DegQ family serine endoprotease [Acidobacteriota bacterium]
MKNSFHIRRTTAILVLVIAALVGGLVATVSSMHNTPIQATTAQAASAAEQAPFGTFAPMVKHVMPAVVNISSTRTIKTQRGAPGGMFDDPLFQRFFGGRMPQMPRERRSQSLGSGVIVSADGYILTNNHVVEDATQVKVSFSDKREFPAKVIGTDKDTDVAVIKIDQQNLPVLPLSDSSHTQVGDVVLAIGNPFGIGQTVTMGIVSATGRSMGGNIERFEDFIQTDASINPGNSGGALVNTHGELVGINTAILAGETGGNQGIGFAIPVNLARNVMDQIRKSGKVTRGFIGIAPQELTPDMARAFGKADLRGVAIASVEPGTPAAKGGLQVGDVITAVNNQPVSDVNAFRLQVAGMAPGTNVNLKVFRSGAYKDVGLTLAELKASTAANGDSGPNVPGGGEKGAMQGVSVQALNSDIRQQLQIPEGTKGVIITDLEDDSPAAQAGLRQGDVIEQVNRKPVTTVQQFNAAVKQGNGDTTLLLVKRGQGTQFVVIPNK